MNGESSAGGSSNLYELLGVSSDAPAAEISRAYRRRARDLHPDASDDPAAEHRFRQLVEAYAVLRDPESRAAYDRSLTARRRGARRRPDGGYTIRVDRVGPREDTSDPRSADLSLTIPITFAEAVRGTEVAAPAPSGTVRLRIPPGTPSGRVFRLRGHGHPAAGGRRGDLYVTVELHVPKRLTARQRELIEELARAEDPESIRAHLRVS